MTAAAEPVTLRVERGAELPTDRRAERDPAMLLPLERGVVTLEVDGRPACRLDRSTFALVPPSTSFAVRADSPVTTLVTLVAHRPALERAEAEYRGHLHLLRFASLVATPRVLPRTRWVDELVHRYVFERDVCEKHGSAAAAFLETELVKELYFLCVEQDEHGTRASVVEQEEGVVTRARAWIDEHLAEPLRVRELAKRCATSESTLLRAFQRELGLTPAAYARDRRLDAALLLLKSGRYAVGEVAGRVGYTSVAAFTEAFRRRFGTPPSRAKARRDDALERLPPHGKTPRRKRRSL